MAEINVAVLIYPGVEVMDMNGPIDVFVKANRYSKNNYKVFTVAESADEIATELSAVGITPKYTLAKCPRPDIIVIPGQIMPGNSSLSFGSGSDGLRAWITDQAQQTGTTVMSVCVGAFILAKTGLLAHKNATTHYKALEGLQQQYKDITFIKNVRFVQDGNFVTTGGITSGIDGALHLVENKEPDVAKLVADIMVYNRDAPLPPGTILS